MKLRIWYTCVYGKPLDPLLTNDRQLFLVTTAKATLDSQPRLSGNQGDVLLTRPVADIGTDCVVSRHAHGKFRPCLCRTLPIYIEQTRRTGRTRIKIK